MDNIKNNFLPESNFIIIPTEIDTEDLSGDEALCYYTLTYDKLMEIDKEHLAYFYNKEMPLSYTFAGVSFDVFDFLSSNLVILENYFPTMTQGQILKMLEQEQLLSSNFIGF